MSQQNQGSGWTAWTFAIVGISLSLAIVYMLSMGPACWLADRDIIYRDNPYLVGFYFPIIRASQACPQFGEFIGWYQSFWVQ